MSCLVSRLRSSPYSICVDGCRAEQRKAAEQITGRHSELDENQRLKPESPDQQVIERTKRSVSTGLAGQCHIHFLFRPCCGPFCRPWHPRNCKNSVTFFGCEMRWNVGCEGTRPRGAVSFLEEVQVFAYG
ncbi:unnamed protein product, partial [Pylaiella littoralis]